MKRTAVLGIAFAAAMCLAIPAAAGTASTQQMGNAGEIDVTVKYRASAEPAVYQVDLEWSSMVFTYTEAGTKVWDPTNHTYQMNVSGSWDKTTAEIKVTNHSNVPVDVEMLYKGENGTGITGTLTNGKGTLKAGEENAYDKADFLKADFKISGTPDSSVTEQGMKIGAITVNIR